VARRALSTDDLTSLDEQIAAAKAALDAAQNRWRSRQRGTPMLGGGNAPVRIDPAARADMLDRGLAVDQAFIRLEQLKKQRAVAGLAELMDPDATAAEDAAVETAKHVLQVATTAETAARMAYQVARGTRKQRGERIQSHQSEIARAEAASRSAEKLHEREATERSAPVVAWGDENG
jgi:hypothetical protein